MGAFDGVKWWPKVKVIKYDQSTIDEITKDIGHEPSGPELRWLEDKHGLTPDGLAYSEGNLLTTVGLNNITKLIIGGAGTAFSNTQAFIGVGDGSTAAAVGNTDLAALTGATHRYVQGADASNPTQANGVITCNSTFTTSNANHAWNEWCWGVGTGTLTPMTVAIDATHPFATTVGLLNRAVPGTSLGTKTSGSWTLQATITLS